MQKLLPHLLFSSQARGTRGCTIVKPFNLSKGKKRTFDEAASTYVPIAQQVEAFHKRTPNRYHLRSKKDESKLPASTSLVRASCLVASTAGVIVQRQSRRVRGPVWGTMQTLVSVCRFGGEQ